MLFYLVILTTLTYCVATSEPEDPIHVEKCPVSSQNRNNSSPENSNCTKYCMFWKNQLIDEIVCPRNFHYSPINETCVSYGDNGCGESTNDIKKVDYGSCIGKCPISDDIEDIFYLPHDDCTKYCICAFGHSLEMKCDDNKHFSTLDNRCVHPAEADMKCPDIRREIEAEAFEETDDCFGECLPLNDNSSQRRKISPHRNETKFCVCINGMFQIHDCPKNQIFIEDDQLCRNLNPRSLKKSLHNHIQSNSNNDNSNENQCSSSDKDKIHTYTKTTQTNTTETKNLTDQEKESFGNEETTFETIITKKIKKTDHEIITTVFNTTTTTIVTVTNTVTPLVSGDQNDGSSGSSTVPSPQCKFLIEQLLQKKIL